MRRLALLSVICLALATACSEGPSGPTRMVVLDFDSGLYSVWDIRPQSAARVADGVLENTGESCSPETDTIRECTADQQSSMETAGCSVCQQRCLQSARRTFTWVAGGGECADGTPKMEQIVTPWVE